MIPLTSEEITLLIDAQMLLARLGNDRATGGALCSGVASGIMLILKCTVEQDLTAMKNADNPMEEAAAQGIEIRPGEALDDLGLRLATAGPLPGRPFTPQSMKPDVPQPECEHRHPTFGGKCRLPMGHPGSHGVQSQCEECGAFINGPHAEHFESCSTRT